MQKLGPNQEKWLQALESGKYNQGKNFLKIKKIILGIIIVALVLPVPIIENFLSLDSVSGSFY